MRRLIILIYRHLFRLEISRPADRLQELDTERAALETERARLNAALTRNRQQTDILLEELCSGRIKL